MAIRIFQMAKMLKVESHEIIDALDDMGIPVKSNLQALDDETVEELRGLFKPKPTVAKKVAKPTPEDAQRKTEEDAARREAARKETARQAALQRAAAKKAELKRRAEEKAAARRAAERQALGLEPIPEPVRPEPPAPPTPPPAATEDSQASPAGEAPAETPPGNGAAPETPAPAAAAPPQAPPPVAARPIGLGKAVVAPPPTTARERERLLGRPIAPRPTRPPGRPGLGVGVGRPGVGRPAVGRPGMGRPGMGRPGMPGMPPPPPGAGPRPGRGKRKKKKGDRARDQERRVPGALAAQREAKPEEPVGEVTVSEGMTVKELSERIHRKSRDLIKALLMGKGILATINQALDLETATWAVEHFGGEAKAVSMEEAAVVTTEGVERDEENLEPRPPVVTFMGHVDHGKTSLLDAIRSTRVAAREAGGITQHIGAYVVEKEREGKMRSIVFLDTPGHEAFTLMRARGASVTDIVVLVVAADDGVMPQTREAINHAKAAGVALVVAINKIDKPGADPERIKQQLTEHELLVEDYGGEVVAVPVSAKTHEGLDHLLEMILLVTDMQEMSANPQALAAGAVLEARKDKTRGPIATVLVQNGTLRAGDAFVVGAVSGKVRALLDEHGRSVEQALPSTPVVVMGLDDVPLAGDHFQVIPDETKARQIVQYRRTKLRDEAMARKTARRSLERLHETIREGEVVDLPLILKADVAGSVEALAQTLVELSTSEVKVRVVHSATGAVTESDVLLATTTNAIIIGFNVRPERGVAEMAKKEGVDIRLHTVIYAVADEVKQAMLGLLAPTLREKYLGRAEVRETFSVPKVGTVAGCHVSDGVVTRDAKIRLLRDNVVVHEGKVASLRRFKDDAREVKSGFECGIGLERYQDLKIGDEIEFFVIEAIARKSLEPSEKAAGS